MAAPFVLVLVCVFVCVVNSHLLTLDRALCLYPLTENKNLPGHPTGESGHMPDVFLGIRQANSLNGVQSKDLLWNIDRDLHNKCKVLT